MYLLAIESSCDDTGAAIFKEDQLYANVVASQLVHQNYGGVVPELASRDHQRAILPTVKAALEQAQIQKTDLSAVAVTYGPGLAGSLLVGLSFAKALSLGLEIPLIGVNHMEGHIYSVFIEGEKPTFPFLCLTVSGGHSEIVLVEEGFKHTKLGKTRDDAAGEAYDKVAKLLGLGYPGGPLVDKLAASGNPTFFDFPRTYLPEYDFSFSGIKTAILYTLNKIPAAERDAFIQNHLADICASFQAAMVDMLERTVRKAVKETGVKRVAVVGGVSANRGLREKLEKSAAKYRYQTYIPPLRFCTDNAAMIGITAYFKHRAGFMSDLSLNAQPNLSV